MSVAIATDNISILIAFHSWLIPNKLDCSIQSRRTNNRVLLYGRIGHEPAILGGVERGAILVVEEVQGAGGEAEEGV